MKRDESALGERIIDTGLIPPGSGVVVGVSGGADSLALLHSVCRLAPQLGWTVIAAHLDHGLREESAAEAEWVAEQARDWGADPIRRWMEVRALAAKRRLSLEAAGRAARYEFFAGVARERACRVVAVGHTADDQAETVLLNLLRGAGLAGLAGMHPCRPLAPELPGVMLIRPFLTVWREEILAYCEAHGLTPLQDPSNHSMEFARNRIRHQLLPLLAREFNPAIRRHLIELAVQARTEAGWRAAQAAELLDQARQASNPGTLTLDTLVLRDNPGLAADALRVGFACLAAPEHSLDRRATGRLLRLLQPDGPPRTDLGGGWTAEREGNLLRIGRAGRLPVPVGLGRHPLAVPGRVELPHAGLWIDACRVPVPQTLTHSPEAVYLDADAVAGEIVVRGPCPGDRFRPLGLGGTKQLSDFFIDCKVPRAARACLPVVADAEKILWVAGMALDDRARLTPASRQALRLRLGRLACGAGRHGIMDAA
jgi:tRNA(Ile)-lysidine synthase